MQDMDKIPLRLEPCFKSIYYKKKNNNNLTKLLSVETLHIMLFNVSITNNNIMSVLINTCLDQFFIFPKQRLFEKPGNIAI